MYRSIYELNERMFLCRTEQLEAFKKHMEAGEINTSAIIMGEENEDETENGQLNILIWQKIISNCLNILWYCINFVLTLWCVLLVPVPLGEKETDDKDVNSEAPSSLSEAASEKESNSVKSRKDEERNNSIKKVTEDCLWISTIPLGTVNTCKIQFKYRWRL